LILQLIFYFLRLPSKASRVSGVKHSFRSGGMIVAHHACATVQGSV